MNIINFIKKYALAMVAVVTVLSFSAFKVSGVDAQQKRMTVAVYFQGNPNNATQVADESLWNTTPNGQTCNFTNQKACMQLVEHTDLTGSNTLDPAKINLGSVSSGVGYIPTRIGGSSSTPFTPINRN
ncbi:hypothetical protein [Sphingobacterium kitahiroshimense]|uniref:Uncharacterized protein n=1 Tax=Sphingobacterium kitahiroshimense TaxID=470446 RepID=A0ABV0BQK5_9SPHI